MNVRDSEIKEAEGQTNMFLHTNAGKIGQCMGTAGLVHYGHDRVEQRALHLLGSAGAQPVHVQLVQLAVL
jgi:hypothetical protein